MKIGCPIPVLLRVVVLLYCNFRIFINANVVADREMISRHRLTISTMAILYRIFLGVLNVERNGIGFGEVEERSRLC